MENRTLALLILFHLGWLFLCFMAPRKTRLSNLHTKGEAGCIFHITSHFAMKNISVCHCHVPANTWEQRQHEYSMGIAYFKLSLLKYLCALVAWKLAFGANWIMCLLRFYPKYLYWSRVDVAKWSWYGMCGAFLALKGVSLSVMWCFACACAKLCWMLHSGLTSTGSSNPGCRRFFSKSHLSVAVFQPEKKLTQNSLSLYL